MSRPLSDGLLYVGIPTNWFRLPEHKILRAKLGMNAMLIWTELYLSSFEITGYYTKVTDDDIAILAMEYGVKENFIREVLHFLAERSMVDATLLRSDKVITSRDIQLTFQEAVKERGKKRVIEVKKRYWLVEPEKTRTFIKLCPDDDFEGKNAGYSGKNSPKNEKNKGSAGRKERREKEKKGHYRKGEKNARSAVNPGKNGRRFYRVLSVEKRAERLRRMYNEVCVPLGLTASKRVTEPVLLCVKKALRCGYTLEDHRRVFCYVGNSRFLRGETKSSFKANLEWLCDPANMEKVLAGKYSDYGKQTRETESAPLASSFDVDDFFAASMARSAKTNEAMEDGEVLPWMKG